MDDEAERRLSEMAKKDAFYCDLLSKCAALSEDYHRIQSQLSPDDRETLERYISICEELEYQRTCMAYAIGLQDGKRRALE